MLEQVLATDCKISSSDCSLRPANRVVWFRNQYLRSCRSKSASVWGLPAALPQPGNGMRAALDQDEHSSATMQPKTMRELGLTVGLDFAEFLDRQSNYVEVMSDWKMKILVVPWIKQRRKRHKYHCKLKQATDACPADGGRHLIDTPESLWECPWAMLSAMSELPHIPCIADVRIETCSLQLFC